MNVFMGYNPLVSKQAKVTVWVCEQDGATPVAPSNPSEGDCFVVYATDEAVLSNTPTSKKTYADGEWADAESGGGGVVIPEITSDANFSARGGTYTSTVPFAEMLQLIRDSQYYDDDDDGNKCYPVYWIGTGESATTCITSMGEGGDGTIAVVAWSLHEDGTVSMRQ